GDDLVFRDPFGNPYIITIDFDYDGKCMDGFYRREMVSLQNLNQGYYGTYRPSTTPVDSFEVNTPVMIWSLGPDGKVDATKKANVDVNKDNILSWVGK
ncbi:MAG: hypothetical protein ABJC04_09935, partial [Verrucomicrobiota bacterium]